MRLLVGRRTDVENDWALILLVILVLGICVWGIAKRVIPPTRRCAICSRHQEAWPLWSVERDNHNVVCDTCINKTVIVSDLRKRIAELEAQVKED